MNSRIKISVIVLLLVFSIFSIAQNPSRVVTTGNNVTVSYTGWIGDHYFNPNTVTFIVGNEEVIKGLDNAVIGMHIGEVKNVTIPPAFAFGEYDPSLVVGVPVSFFALTGAGLPSIGEQVNLNDVNGIVINITSEYVVVDTNNLLAGEELNMSIKLLSVNP